MHRFIMDILKPNRTSMLQVMEGGQWMGLEELSKEMLRNPNLNPKKCRRINWSNKNPQNQHHQTFDNKRKHSRSFNFFCNKDSIPSRPYQRHSLFTFLLQQSLIKTLKKNVHAAKLKRKRTRNRNWNRTKNRNFQSRKKIWRKSSILAFNTRRTQKPQWNV